MEKQKSNTPTAAYILGGITLGMLGILMWGLPTPVLSLCIVLNLTISLVVLLSSLMVRRTEEMQSLPVFMILHTLFRIALMVSIARAVLDPSLGHSEDKAGSVIAWFGDIVGGGNTIVGFIVFLILFLILFLVVTKGTMRISEVAARFRLDALPGKQMSIDADLAAGHLGANEARQQRDGLQRESEFYASLDGMSKIVQGETVAGAIFAAVIFIGGIATGLSLGMDFVSTLNGYALLTIGAGLSHLLSILLSALAVGFLSTRPSKELPVGEQIVQETANHPFALFIVAAGLLCLFGTGMFGLLGNTLLILGAGLIGYQAWRLQP